MDTRILNIDAEDFKTEELELAAEYLREGKLVAFPTETVYGLGANAMDESAARRIYEAKGRPSDNPLIVHIAKAEDMNKLALDIPDMAYQLAEVFWPGPLTMILKKKDYVPDTTSGGLSTIGIRLPANKIARKLISSSGVFVAAPSANLSGKPSPTKAEHVINDLNGRVDMIIDGGHATLGLESTIVDLTGGIPMILRPGCITKAMLEHTIEKIEYDPVILKRNPDIDLKPKAPGMKYRHYAPEGTLTIYEGDTKKVIDTINQQAKDKLALGKSVGIIATSESKALYQYGDIKTVGSRSDEATIAARLYEILREFDKMHTEYIYSESFEDNPLGQAIMNRLLKAAGYKVIKVI